MPELVDVNSDLQITSPQLLIDIDRDKASTLGLNVQQVEDTLYSAFGQRQVSTIYTSTNQYSVILELDPRFQRDASALSMLYLRNREGRLIPLESVINLKESVGPQSVNHYGQLPAVNISFNLRPGVHPICPVMLGDAKLATAMVVSHIRSRARCVRASATSSAGYSR